MAKYTRTFLHVDESYEQMNKYNALTRLASSSAFSSSVLSSRETCVGPSADGEPLPLQSLCSRGRRWPREGGLELCMLAERYRKGTYTGKEFPS